MMMSDRPHVIVKTVVFRWDAPSERWWCSIYDTPPSDHMHSRSKAYRLEIPVPDELTQPHGTIVGEIKPYRKDSEP